MLQLMLGHGQQRRQPTVVQCPGGLALVCSGIYANETQPADFVLESYKIQTYLIGIARLAWVQ